VLSRLYATNYRCLVNFEFKPTTKQLIIGRNGTGKTAVLDVLAMLRDFAVRGKPCEGYLGGKTRTRWQNVAEQRFELDVTCKEGKYHYTLSVDEDGDPPHSFVKQERLNFNATALLRFQEGLLSIFDQEKPSLKVEFLLDRSRSSLAIASAQLPDQTRLAWFNRWLGGLLHVQINPWAMSARSERESRYPTKDLSDFADWYRHLRLENFDAVSKAIEDLREAIPGFQALDAKEAGLDVRVLQARMRDPSYTVDLPALYGKAVDLPFSDLSEGQRVLIALYVLLHCAVTEDSTLLIDEPDNFIALSEIQPWLLKLLDRVDEHNAQVILVSHHPELLNQLAGQGGVLLDRPNGGETRVLAFSPPDDSGLTPSEIIARGWEYGESVHGLPAGSREDATHRVKRLYEGYIIEVTAFPSQTGGFTAHFCIRKDAKSYTDETPIPSGEVFATANEALEAGFELGKQRIDAGFHPTKIVLDQ